MSQYSEACCTIPPVVIKGYQSKGDYITVDGLNTYAVGPASAKSGILFLYDIFGLYPQTIQGADILALSNADHPYQVFMPDWFEGKPADLSWYPPDTEEKKKQLMTFISGTAALDKVVPRIPKVVQELNKQYPNIEKWGVVGYCWGAKVVALSTGEGTPFKVAAQCHPALIDPQDAKNVTVPICILPSKDENPKEIQDFAANLKVKNYVETFHDQVHGWLGARANLEDERVKSEYIRGYQILLNFFNEYI